MLTGTKRGDGLFERCRVISAHVQCGAEDYRLLYPGIRAELLGKLELIRTADRPRGKVCLLDNFGGRPMCKEIAVQDEGKPMAALGFIHVVRCNQKRQSLPG